MNVAMACIPYTFKKYSSLKKTNFTFFPRLLHCKCKVLTVDDTTP